MSSLNWGNLHREYAGRSYDPEYTKTRQKALLKDLEVQKDAGIYEYILSGEVRRALLNLRMFDDVDKNIKIKIYRQQDGKCKICGDEMDLDEAHADHIKPWSKGGRTEEANCQVVHRWCNQNKGAK